MTANNFLSSILFPLMVLFLVSLTASAQDLVWSQRTIHDADGNKVIVFICEGSKEQLEAVVFSMNVYGDGTLTGFDSLKQFGRGRIAGSQIALAAVPAWAGSVFSSEPDEQEQNRAFRELLIRRKILTRKNRLTPVYAHTPASLLFYFSDMKQEAEAAEIHENSHVLYNNIARYKDASRKVFGSLTESQSNCVNEFFKTKSMYAAGDPEVKVDEFMAYYSEEYRGLKACFDSFGEDVNGDGAATAAETYLWRTSHPEMQSK